jgi:DNA-binding transcriptional ArsR family regulator
MTPILDLHHLEVAPVSRRKRAGGAGRDGGQNRRLLQPPAGSPARGEAAAAVVCLVGKSTSWRNAANLTSPPPRTKVNRMVRYSVLDRTFSALSDPTRRHILERLARGPATVSELAQPFDITLPALLKHVRILEQADLVTTEKHGRTRQCRLGTEPLDDAAQWIQTYRHHWEGRLDRLGSYLDKHKGARR